LNVLKFFARWSLLGACILLSVFITACGPAPLGIDWPAISTIGEAQNILVANGQQLLMVDPVSGQPVQLRTVDGELRLDDEGNPRIWEIKGSDAGNAEFYSSPIAVDDSTLLVAAYNDRLFEINVPAARVENPSGDRIVDNDSAHVVADLAANDDLVFIGMSGRDLIALNRDDLSDRWLAPTGHGIWSPPLIADDVLYFSSLDHFLYAVNADTGELLWQLDLEGTATSAPAYAPPVEEGDTGHLYVGSFARKIFDISTEGEILDEYATHGWVWSAPALVDGVLYAADLDGWVYALDAENGLSEVWAPRQLAPSSIRPTPLVLGDTIIVATRDGRVHWLDRTDGSYLTDTNEESGGFVDRIRGLKGQIFSDLLLIQPSESVDLENPIVVVSTMAPEELLVAFDVTNGQRLWSYPQQ
jgi:outer membrane protein assembly factor BamB